MRAGPGRSDTEAAYLQARIVAVAVLVSAVVVAGVGFALSVGSPPAGNEALATLLFAAWVAAAIAATVGWWVLWRRAAAAAEAVGIRAAIEAGGLSAAPVLQRLVWAYALLEGQLMIAFAASFLQRTPMLLVPAFVIVALGIVLSFPRREWFASLAHGGAAPR